MTAPSESPKLRLLCLAADFDQIGGIQNYNRALVDAIRRQGGLVRVVERRPGGLWAKAAFLLRAMWAALTFAPDAVLCTHLNFGPLARVLKGLLGLPYALFVYGIEVSDLSGGGSQRTVKEAGLLVYLFEHTLGQVEAQVPGARAKAFSLLSAVDGKRFRPLPPEPAKLKALGLEGCRVLLTLGRMSRADGDNKGYRRVLEAFPRVIEAVPEARYLLVGGGDDAADVRAWVEAHGLEGKVLMPGPPPFEDLPAYYNLAEVFVLPSKHEGFPAIVMLEALACGVPVIGGDQPGAESALMDGALGLVVPSEDRAALAEAMVRMLRSEDWKDREAIRARALARYGVERFDREVGELLGRLASLLPVQGRWSS